MTNASFAINEGDAVLLSGSNGIGKSTLLNSILGLLGPDEKISGATLPVTTCFEYNMSPSVREFVLAILCVIATSFFSSVFVFQLTFWV